MSYRQEHTLLSPTASQNSVVLTYSLSGTIVTDNDCERVEELDDINLIVIEGARMKNIGARHLLSVSQNVHEGLFLILLPTGCLECLVIADSARMALLRNRCPSDIPSLSSELIFPSNTSCSQESFTG